MASKRTNVPRGTSKPKAKRAKRPQRRALTPAEAMRRQTVVREIVALVVAPGMGIERRDAESIARKVVADHPAAFTGDVVPIVIAHVERALLEAA